MTTIRIQEHEILLTPLHEIPSLPSWHPCARVHGHTYTVTLILETEVPDGAVVVDPPAELDDVDAWARELVGQHLSELMPDGVAPTEEHIAIWVYEMWKPVYPQLGAVAITSGTDREQHPRIEYRPGGARPGHFLVDETRHLTVPIGWDGRPIYPDDAVVPEAPAAK